MAGGILETFYFMFQADTTNVQDGTDAGTQSAERLTQTLNQTDQAATNMGHNFLDTIKGIGAALVGLVAVGALKSMAEASADATDELRQQARELHTDVSLLDAWQKGVEGADGSASEFNATLKKLAEGGRDPYLALERLSGQFKGLSDIKADKLGERLGIDKGTVEILRQGKQGISDMLERQKLLGVVTKEQAEIAKKYKDQVKDTNTVYDDVRRRIATEILPYLTMFQKAMEKLTIWSRDNKYFVLAFFGAVGTILTVAYIPTMWRAVAATYALLAPYLLIGAAVAAVGLLFALAFDDVMNFLDGNDSVIGELAKKWPIVGDVVRGLAEAFRFSWEAAKLYLGFFVDLFTQGPTQAVENFGNKFNEIMAKIFEKFPQLKPIFEAVGNAAAAVANGIMMGWQSLFDFIKGILDFVLKAADKVQGGISAVKGFFGVGGGDKKDEPKKDEPKKTDMSAKGKTEDANAHGPRRVLNAPGSEKAIEGAKLAKQEIAKTNHPLASQTSNSIANSKTSNKSTSVNIAEIKIVTQATDAKGIADGVSQGLNDQLKNAKGQFETGVAI